MLALFIYLYVPFIFFFWKLYFASTSQKTIERVDLNGGSRHILVSDGLDSPEGLAIDWVHRRMYWTDKRCMVFALSECWDLVMKRLFDLVPWVLSFHMAICIPDICF